MSARQCDPKTVREHASQIFRHVGIVAETLVDESALLDDQRMHQVRIALLEIVSQAGELDEAAQADELIAESEEARGKRTDAARGADAE